MFKSSYVHHNGTCFRGFGNQNTPEDRIEWLDDQDDDGNFNIYMMIQ